MDSKVFRPRELNQRFNQPRGRTLFKCHEQQSIMELFQQTALSKVSPRGDRTENPVGSHLENNRKEYR